MKFVLLCKVDKKEWRGCVRAREEIKFLHLTGDNFFRKNCLDKIFWALIVKANIMIKDPRVSYCQRIEVYTYTVSSEITDDFLIFIGNYRENYILY